MGNTGVASRARKALAAALALATLTGCAGTDLSRLELPNVTLPDVVAQFELEPVAGWQPDGWATDTGVTLGHISEARAAGEGQTSGTAMPGTAAQPADVGLVEWRIRNDAIGLAARYVELPMAHALNERMEELVRLAIGETHGSYTPQVSAATAGLSDRGCVPGSLSWTSEQVLRDPATGPAKASGTAMTCEVLGAFGSLVEVGVRIVTGSAPAGGDATITSHRVYTLYADVADGTLHEGVQRWNDAAPADLWQRTVTELRRDAGGLSAAEFAAPDESQLALAKAALDTARTLESGDVLVTMREGLTAPELAGLSGEHLGEPIEVTVEADVAAGWMGDDLKRLEAQRTLPFVGLPAWSAQLPVNCALVPCIAVTFDDGPSEFTPSLLDTLQEHQAAATFFVLGSSAQRYPDTLMREVAEGHEVGSHTMKHLRLPTLELDEAHAEVRDAATVITQTTGAQVLSFRPPYGEINDKILDEVKLPAILWSIDTNDWKEPGTQALIDRAVTPAKVGDIILFHDTHKTTIDAADQVLTALADRGFTLVTVSKLFDGKLPEGKVHRR